VNVQCTDCVRLRAINVVLHGALREVLRRWGNCDWSNVHDAALIEDVRTALVIADGGDTPLSSGDFPARLSREEQGREIGRLVAAWQEARHVE
jgi:hypothetical protein